MNIVKVVSVIIGTIIGAGFASGKEIYIFFGQYGKFGIIGAIVSATLTGVIIYSTIAITKKLQIKSNHQWRTERNQYPPLTRGKTQSAFYGLVRLCELPTVD